MQFQKYVKVYEEHKMKTVIEHVTNGNSRKKTKSLPSHPELKKSKGKST